MLDIQDDNCFNNILVIYGFIRNCNPLVVVDCSNIDVMIQLIFEFISNSTINNEIIDRGYGLIMGGAIGDSLGSFVEFSYSRISDEKMDIVFTMPGEGGTWVNCCTKGQVTDDTELGMALTYSLLKMKNENNNIFDEKYICYEYHQWYESGPFDIGKTTSKPITQSDNGTNANKMIAAAKKHNVYTKEKYRGLGGVRSNGSLMR
eukprot:377786_1